MSSTGPRSVLIADGHRLRGAGSAAALTAAGASVETVWPPRNVGAAARRLRPDIVILAVDVPSSGVVHCSSLTSLGARVLLLGEELDMNVLHRGVTGGAWGYLTGEASLATVAAAVRLIHAGEAVFSRAMVTLLTRGLRQRQHEEALALERYLRLTRREQEVLGLVAAGHDDGGIAGALGIAPATARWHVGNVQTKLGAPSRNAAAAFAQRLTGTVGESPRIRGMNLPGE